MRYEYHFKKFQFHMLSFYAQIAASFPLLVEICQVQCQSQCRESFFFLSPFGQAGAKSVKQPSASRFLKPFLKSYFSPQPLTLKPPSPFLTAPASL